jgi:hypothetical protein
VTLSSPVRLSDKEKLEILQRLDQFRSWRFLDEQRYCLVCCQIITGRQIQVVGDSSGNGSFRLRCPTDGCNSIPMDWMLPTDEVLASAKMASAEEPNISVSASADSGAIDRLASHLRKFATHFKRAWYDFKERRLGQPSVLDIRATADAKNESGAD